MAENPQLFRKVTIIGIGLIGGSNGMALKKNNFAREVIGVSRQHSSLVQALKSRAIDKASHDVRKSVQDADLVILATPVKTIISMFTVINKSLKRGCIVTDVGSTKEAIVAAAEKHLPSHALFVGSHPLAGSEKKGAAFGSAELFNGSICIMTPTEKTNKAAVDKVKTLWMRLGANVKTLPADEHDKALAYISHLPHLLAYGLIDVIPPDYVQYAAQGLKDTTRIASSDPDMWKDVCITNSQSLLKALDEYAKVLAAFRKAIVSKDEPNLLEIFKKSKNKRDGLDKP